MVFQLIFGLVSGILGSRHSGYLCTNCDPLGATCLAESYFHLGIIANFAYFRETAA
jgi:hypothetical protein